jgi:putative methyltransferase (TIGR04325 family)
MELIKKIFRIVRFLVFKKNYRLLYSKKISGYNNSLLNKSIIKKTIIFSKLSSINKHDINFQRTTKFLKFIKKKKLKSIVDFGGGAGYHYFIAKIKLSNFNFKWSIVENAMMVRLCKKKLKYRNLFFFNSLDKIKKSDVFFSSCAINYTKNPFITLKKIFNLKVRYFYITRTPFSTKENLEFKQSSLLSDNGPCKIKNEKEILIEYKNKIINMNNFENILKNKYIILSKYIDEKKAFCFGNKCFDTYTYIIKKK